MDVRSEDKNRASIQGFVRILPFADTTMKASVCCVTRNVKLGNEWMSNSVCWIEPGSVRCLISHYHSSAYSHIPKPTCKSSSKTTWNIGKLTSEHQKPFGIFIHFVSLNISLWHRNDTTRQRSRPWWRSPVTAAAHIMASGPFPGCSWNWNFESLSK